MALFTVQYSWEGKIGDSWLVVVVVGIIELFVVKGYFGEALLVALVYGLLYLYIRDAKDLKGLTYQEWKKKMGRNRDEDDENYS